MLQEKRVILRAMEPGDVELLYRWENEPEVWDITGTFAPVSRFALEQYVMNSNDFFSSKQLRLMIEEKKHQTTIGSIDIFDYSPLHRRAEIGIIIIREFRRKGLGKESLMLALRYVKETLGLHQLYCHIHADNKNSIALFKNAGFRFVGRKKDWVKESGNWKDVLFYQILL